MYKFLIIAHEGKSRMEDNGQQDLLRDITEIHLVANSTADALNEARHVFMAKNYYVRRIERLNPIELKEMENLVKFLNEHPNQIKKEEGI